MQILNLVLWSLTMFREAKLLSFTATTVTSRITLVTSLAKTCVFTCTPQVGFVPFIICPMFNRKKKRAIIEDSLLYADITASKVKRQVIVCSIQPIGLSGPKVMLCFKIYMSQFYNF